MNKPIEILVFQSDDVAYHKVREALWAHPGFDAKKFSFKMLGTLADATELLIPGDRQLLVTGTYHGSTGGIIKLVTEFRQKNPQLVCMSYSVMDKGMPGLFDLTIKKTSAYDTSGLISAIDEFLAGKINVRASAQLSQQQICEPTCPSCGHTGTPVGPRAYTCPNCHESFGTA